MATAQLYTRSPLCSYKAEEKWRRKTFPSFRAHRFLSFLLLFFHVAIRSPSYFYSSPPFIPLSFSFPILNLLYPDIFFHTLFLFRILMNASTLMDIRICKRCIVNVGSLCTYTYRCIYIIILMCTLVTMNNRSSCEIKVTAIFIL